VAINILLILGSGLGSNLGPNFNLTADVGSVIPSTATKSELLAGKIVSVDNIATQVTVTSIGVCYNSITQTIPCASTTTTTTTAAPTTTTTASPTTTTTTAAPTTTTTTVSPSSTTTTTTTTAAPTTTTTAAPTTTTTSTTTAAPTTTTTTTTTVAPTTTTTTASPTTTTTTTAAPCTLTIYFDVSQSPGTQGWNSSGDACTGTGTPLTVYFSNTPNGCPTTFQDVFNDGKAIYTDSSLTTVLAGNDKYYKSVSSPNSGISIQVGNDGFIDTLSGPC